MLGTLMVRLPSVISFALLPWVVWQARPAASRMIPWGPLLAVTWLPLLYFGTEARAYALFALVNALAWIRGSEWIGRGRSGAACFGAAAACLPLLHYGGWASFLALPTLAFIVPRSKRRVFAITLACASVPALLWLPVMLNAPRESMGWLTTAVGPGRPGVATLSVLAPAGPFPGLFEMATPPIPWWASLSILAVLICGAVVGGRRLLAGEAADERLSKRALQLGLGLMPAGALGVAALCGLPLYFAGRTESMVWAMAAALVGLLASGLQPAARRVAVGSYVVVGAATIVMWFAAAAIRPPAPGVEVGHQLAPMLEEGDRVVAVGLWQLELRHGLVESVQGGSAIPSETVDVETLPRSQAHHPGWFDRESVISAQLLHEARELRQSVETRPGRIWFVWSLDLPLEINVFPAFSGWQRSQVGRSSMIAVDLLVPPPTEDGTN